MKKIDFEAHFYTRDFLETIRDSKSLPTYSSLDGSVYHGGDARVALAPIMPQLLDFADHRLGLMDDAGVEKAVLSISLGLERMDTKRAPEMAIRVNDALAEVIQKRPDRYAGYVNLNADCGEESLLELERCKKELGFVGWGAFSNYNGVHLDDEKYFPLLKKAADLGLFVYIHPTVPLIPALHGFGPAMLMAGYGFAIDMGICVNRMIFNGVFDRLPHLKIIIGHLGEGFPFYMERLDRLSRRVQNGKNNATNKHISSYYFQNNIWVSTSGNFSAPAFHCTTDVLGVERIVFGSDYPMETYKQSVDFIESLGLSQETRDRIYNGNAREHFGF